MGRILQNPFSEYLPQKSKSNKAAPVVIQGALAWVETEFALTNDRLWTLAACFYPCQAYTGLAKTLSRLSVGSNRSILFSAHAIQSESERPP